MIEPRRVVQDWILLCVGIQTVGDFVPRIAGQPRAEITTAETPLISVKMDAYRM
jgi:hypothetical protein